MVSKGAVSWEGAVSGKRDGLKRGGLRKGWQVSEKGRSPEGMASLWKEAVSGRDGRSLRRKMVAGRGGGSRSASPGVDDPPQGRGDGKTVGTPLRRRALPVFDVFWV